MKVFVQDTCIGCGLCASVCPQVFRMTKEGVAKALQGSVPPEKEEAAREALEGCPVSAIQEKEADAPC